ncbi:MAG: phosphoribosylaminoimidazolesuccinocarboxamide synthase [Ignavibacteria bacterium]
MGSVKDLTIIQNPTHNHFGIGRFTFSDRYSVFDWGEMPDSIPDKGKSIAVLAAYFFEKLLDLGIPTHYQGLIEGGKTKNLKHLQSPSNIMEIKLLRVIKPEVKNGIYDYTLYRNEKGNFLIPIEVIYRNYLPAGSSIFKRIEKGELSPADLGLTQIPTPNQKLDKPLLDVSTKLEITDRYMSWDEAMTISGMNERELQSLKQLTLTINSLITEEFNKIGLINEDGKIEVGFDSNRSLIVVDVLGTLDECRFTYEGLPVSKEIARIYYRNTDWAKAVDEAKAKDRQHWKEICALQPPRLPETVVTLISQIYRSCTNLITGKEWFKDVPALNTIVQEIKKELKL